MGKKLAMLLIIGLIIFGISKVSCAAMCSVGHGDDHGTAQAAEEKSAAAVDVGNKVCPVTGETIQEDTKATYEYKGKIYNFCCPACISEFKKNPGKYSAKAEQATSR